MLADERVAWAVRYIEAGGTHEDITFKGFAVGGVYRVGADVSDGAIGQMAVGA